MSNIEISLHNVTEIKAKYTFFDDPLFATVSLIIVNNDGQSEHKLFFDNIELAKAYAAAINSVNEAFASKEAAE
jgi:predicted aminopeptidase